MTFVDPDKFETAYAEFWESQECTELNNILYDLMKAAFSAGYRAAGATPPEYRRMSKSKRENHHPGR